MTNKISIISQSPYYDDFDPNDKYVRVLFRPSFPVQARELTTLQSILQNQVSNFADTIYKDGSRITESKLSIETKAEKLVLTGTGNANFTPDGARVDASFGPLSRFEGKIITNAAGTVKARVLTQPTSSDLTKNVGNLYITYITGEKFSSTGDYIYALVDDNPSETTNYYNTFSSKSDCTVAQLEAGIYYIKGIFNELDRQTVVISETSASPTVDVGLSISEKAITHNDDISLYDNARGTTNEGAPGANRLKLEMTFVSQPVDSVNDPNFYRLATITNGKLQEHKEVDKQMQSILDLLAERTNDESGSYTVVPLTGVVEESVSSDSEFDIVMNPSKSYVEGYKVDFQEPKKLSFDRGNDSKWFFNYQLSIDGTPFFYITETANPGYTDGEVMDIRDPSNNVLGKCRFYHYVTEVEDGVQVNKIYVYDIKMFQTVTVDSTSGLSIGDDLIQGGITSYVQSIDSDNSTITLVNTSGEFGFGSVESYASGYSGTVSAVVRNTLTSEDNNGDQIVNNLNSASGTANVVHDESRGYYGNINASLIYPIGTHAKSLQLDDDGINRDVQFSTTTGALSTGVEKDKTLKFGYLKIKNRTATETRTSGYGWLAEDREINLGTTNVHTVYGINKSSDNTFDNGRFTRITIDSSINILQGYMLQGKTSGSKAVVALSKVTNVNENNQFGVSDTNHHITQTGSGLNGVVEVIFTKGQSFTEGETLTVKNLANELETHSDITFTEIFQEPTGTDITSSYLLDDGQRTEFYDVSRLLLKPTATRQSAGSGDLIVFFSYFESGTDGQFYSIDSYENLDLYNIDVKYFKDPVGIKRKLSTLGEDLRNVIDFRMRVNPSKNTNLNPFAFSNRTFVDSVKVLPKSSFVMDYESYLGRIDSVYLMKDGSFNIIKGIPGLNPSLSNKKNKGMKIFDVHIPPIPRYLDEEVKVEWVDNKRYTMRDIGDLETRISRLEDAVSLSLLESQALIDDVGLRTKMGIIVDDFSTVKDLTNTPADFSHPEFNSSFDIIKKELIPGQTDGVQLPVEIDSTTNINNTFFPNYIIKSFTEEVMLNQFKSTGTHRINPFGTWIFNALLALDPNMDSWRIRRNDYFTNLYGDVQPFLGNDSEFEQFQQITTASSGGASTTLSEWIGNPRTSRTQRGRTITTNTFQARKTITTTSFDKPRAVDGAVTETLAGTEVIQNPQDYWMRSQTINYSAEGLKPSTVHEVVFGNNVVNTSITSDTDGKVSGSFVIPSMTYRAGARLVSVRDTETGGNLSKGNATYTSQGHLDTYNVVQDVETVTTNEVTTPNVLRSSVVRREDNDNDRGDPIAQMFQLPVTEVNGVAQRYSSIVTSIDLWLSNVDTRTSMNKIIVEIRSSVNGYPGGPDATLGTTGEVVLASTDGVATPTIDNSKNFKFIQPVKLYSDIEYCIVIKSPSDIMEVFVAKMGETMLDGTTIHSSQPNVGGYYGSFFISQNQTTWEPDQNTDLTFRLNRAKFDLTDSTISYKNIISDTGIFKGDIGAYNQGLAFTTYHYSNYVMVHHPNHGLVSGDDVIISTGTFDSDVGNGIPSTEFNGQFDVLYPTLNTYFIQVSSKANFTGRIDSGTFETFATQNVIYDSMITNFNVIKEEEDEVSLSATTYYGTTTAGRNSTPKYIWTGNTLTNMNDVGGYGSETNEIDLNSLTSFEYPMMVKNDLNDDVINSTTFQMTLTMGSSNQYSSPFYRISNAVYPILFRNITGYMIDSEISIMSIDSDTSSSDLQVHAQNIAAVESSNDNTDYITKEIELEYPADGFTIFFDADMAPGSELKFAYKAKESGDDRSIEDLSWIDFPDTQNINETNNGSFNSFEDFKSYEIRTTDEIGTDLYDNAETNIGYEFQSFKLRIRMKVNNSSIPPRIKNLRIIADL